MAKPKTKTAHITKDRLLKRIVKRVAPDGMSFSEYVLQCTVNGVNVSLDDPLYFGWLLQGCFDSAYDDVRDMLLTAINLEYTSFDWSSDQAVGAMMGPIIDSMRQGSSGMEFAERLFRAILTHYRNSEIGSRVYRLNRGFGITTMSYFQDGTDGISIDWSDIFGTVNASVKDKKEVKIHDDDD